MTLFVKHRKMRDVCLSVVEKNHEDGFVVIKGVWINSAMGDPFVMGNRKGPAVETFRIPLGIYQTEWRESEEVFKP